MDKLALITGASSRPPRGRRHRRDPHLDITKHESDEAFATAAHETSGRIVHSQAPAAGALGPSCRYMHDAEFCS